MSYYANGIIEIKFENNEEKEKLNTYLQENENSADIVEYCEQEFSLYGSFIDDDDKLNFFVSKDGNYHEEDQTLAGIIELSGAKCLYDAEFNGEDGSMWKISNKTGEFVEENGGFVSTMSVDDIIKYLTPTQSDELMRKLQIPYIKEDVLSQNEFIPEETAEFIAECYVEGRYDCNLSYWDNINNLIEENCKDIELLAYNIEWDTDGEDIELPTEVILPEGMIDEDEISDYLSDLTGFCHEGYEIEEFDREAVFKSLINAENIDLLNKLDNMQENEITEACYNKCNEPEAFKQIENKVFALMQDENEPFSNPEYYKGLAKEYDAPNAKEQLSAEIYNCDLLYMTAIADVMKLERPKTAGDFLKLKEENKKGKTAIEKD